MRMCVHGWLATEKRSIMELKIKKVYLRSVVTATCSLPCIYWVLLVVLLPLKVGDEVSKSRPWEARVSIWCFYAALRHPEQNLVFQPACDICLWREAFVKLVSYSLLTYVCPRTQLLDSASWVMSGSHTYKTFPPCCHRDSVTTFKLIVQVCLQARLRKGKLRYSHQHTATRAQPESYCLNHPQHQRPSKPVLGLATLQKPQLGHKLAWSLAIWNCEWVLRTSGDLFSCSSPLVVSQV